MLLVFLGTSSQGVEKKGFVYKDPVHHYSIRFPGGWKRIPQKELLMKIEEIIQSVPSSAEFISKLAVGFNVEDNGYSQYPYISKKKFGLSFHVKSRQNTSYENCSKKEHEFGGAQDQIKIPFKECR